MRGRVVTALQPGTSLGPYLIVAPLGAGGMGEVYKARDTRLDRSVAIKVLPADVAVDPQARERFEREARAVAALNHPHICTLHDVGTLEGFDFLVMELLEGETLAARLSKGALPIAHALQIAIQIVLGTRHGPSRRHRASRSQARQRLPRPQWRTFSPAHREAARFRLGQGHEAARRDELDDDDGVAGCHGVRLDRRHDSVHGAGTNRREGGRRAARTSSRSAPSCSKCSRRGKRSRRRATPA